MTRDFFAIGGSEDDGPSARATKSDAAFRTISEVAEDLDVPQHVLRFWETKFTQIRPLKRGGGRRYYRPEDIALLRRIRALLYTDGMTIRGVQKLLRETGAKTATAEATQPGPGRGAITQVLQDLKDMRDELRAALR